MRKKIITIIIIVAILCVSGLVAWRLIATSPQPPINKPEEVSINAKEYIAENKDYEIQINYPARVSARDIVKLGVLVNGQIIEGDVPLKAGQYFKKGDLIVNIYDKDFKSNLMASKSQYLAILARALPDIKIDFPKEFEKWSEFFDKISLEEDLPNLPKINSTKEKVYVSAKNILSNYYSIKQAEIVLDKYKIYAPFNGVFKTVTKEVGAIATAGGELGTISSIDNLELSIGVSPLEAKLISKNKYVKINSEGGKIYKGRVVRVSQLIEQSTQRVMVYISLNEPTMDVIEGQLIEASLELNSLKNVIRVPREIINKYGQIYKIVDNRLYPIEANILINVGKYSYISGIENGTRIIYESLIEPKTGTKVNIIEKVQNN